MDLDNSKYKTISIETGIHKVYMYYGNQWDLINPSEYHILCRYCNKKMHVYKNDSTNKTKTLLLCDDCDSYLIDKNSLNEVDI